MFWRGFRRRTGRPVRELDTLFRGIAADAQDTYPMASGVLNHFMDGAGAPEEIPRRWLRSFRVIRRAERRNHRRFERRLVREARALSDGGSTWVHDHWDARINAFIGTELFYVSRMSLLRSEGSFTLTRTGAEVKVSGTVRHHWRDPYDWDRGRWVYIPKRGFVPISVGRELVESDAARDFLMEARHVQTLEGTLRLGPRSWWPRPEPAEFTWSVVDR